MKKKIAVFQYDLGVGGIQKSLVNLLNNLDYGRYEVDLYLSESERFFDAHFPAGVRLLEMPPVSRLYSFLPFDYGLKRVKLPFEEGAVYDLAVDFNSYQFACAAGALQVPARKRVMWIHNDVRIKYQNEWKYRVLWFFFRGKFRHFDGFCPVTAALIEPFRAMSGVKDKPFTVLNNFIDAEEIRRLALEEAEGLSLDGGCVNLVALGRLCHQKGYDLMLDAFAAACRTRDELCLYIIGDGPEHEALERQAASLGLGEKVRFLGNQPNPFRYMARMDGFVSTSRYEGQGMNIYEARALGLPLYCSKNLEAYIPDLRGYEDMAAALAGAEKSEKHPDGLEDYDRAILERFDTLFD